MDAETTAVTAGLVFARVAGLCTSLPVWQMEGVPRAAPILVAITTTALIAPNVAPVTPGTGLWIAAGAEVVLGLTLGAVVSAVFNAVAVAGEVISSQSGANLGNVPDPILGGQVGVLGRVSTLVGMVVFVLGDLHLRCLEAVARSFDVAPPGSLLFPAPELMVGAASACFSLGIQLAAPLIVGGFVVQLLMAVLGRLAPRMHVFFAVGGPLASLVAIALFAASLYWMAAGARVGLDQVVPQIATLGRP